MHMIDDRYSKDAAITIEIIVPVSSPLETRICHYMCINMICHYVTGDKRYVFEEN